MRVREVSILQVLNDYYDLDLDTGDSSERKTVCCLAGHEDHEPSLMLYPRENTAYCFGCQTWLDPARAVVLKLACSRTVACRELNEKYNLGLANEELNQQELYDKELAAYIEAAQAELQRHPEAINALETRGITDALIAQNRIGYAPQRHDYAVLKLLGVIQFSECIVLPLYHNSQLVGVQGWNYGGRGNRPKYLYPSSHHKALWGITSGYELVLLVEGYFDALSLHAANIPALCAGGTHITSDRKNHLKNFKTVVILFDNDNAGLKAAEKLAAELPNAKLVTAEAWCDACLGLDIKDVSDLWQNVSREQFVVAVQKLQEKAVSGFDYILAKLQTEQDEDEQQRLYEQAAKYIGLLSDVKRKNAIKKLSYALAAIGLKFTDRELNAKVRKETFVPHAAGSAACYFDGDRFVGRRLADELLAEKNFITFTDTQEVYLYNEDTGLYEPGGEVFVENAAQGRLGERVTNQYVSEVLGIIRRNHYFKRGDLDENPDLIPVANGIIDRRIKDASGIYKLIPYSPSVPYISKITTAYDPAASYEDWEALLAGTLPGEEDFLQELFGDALYRNLKLKYWVFHYGPGFNGKTVVLNVITGLVGEDNAAHESWENLERNQFALANLFGKFVNTVGDIGKKTLKETANMKKCTGRDSIRAEKKFQNSFTFYSYAKQHHAANDLPKTTDTSKGFFRRVYLLDYPYTFVEDPKPDTTERKLDPDIEERLLAPNSLSGMLNWALKGLDRLLENKKFTKTSAGQNVKERWMKRSDSLGWFVSSNVSEDKGAFVYKEALEASYVDFCAANDLIVESTHKVTARLPTLIATKLFRPGGGTSRPNARKDIFVEGIERWTCKTNGQSTFEEEAKPTQHAKLQSSTSTEQVESEEHKTEQTPEPKSRHGRHTLFSKQESVQKYFFKNIVVGGGNCTEKSVSV